MHGLDNGKSLHFNLSYSKNTSQKQGLRLGLKSALSTQSPFPESHPMFAAASICRILAITYVVLLSSWSSLLSTPIINAALT